MEPIPLQQFFDEYFQALEAQGWPAVILHTWQDLPVEMSSDVDYAVDGVSMHRLLCFLSEFSRERGWRLIQAIEHEPDAFYCVCIQSGGNFESVLLDVTKGYRRVGHQFVDAATLVEGRRRIAQKSFFVARQGVELRYILAKGAAKGKKFAELESRVEELLAEDRMDCLAALQEGYREPMSWSVELLDLELIGQWYDREPDFEAVRSGRRFGIEELLLYCRRILRPTGICVSLIGGVGADERGRLIEILRPGFRRMYSSPSFGLLRWPEMILRIIKTSLIVESRSKPCFMWTWFKNRVFLDVKDEVRVSESKVINLLARRMECRLGIDQSTHCDESSF